MGAGVDAVIEHSEHIGTLTRTVGRMPERMGHFVLALILDHVHHLGSYAEAQRARSWLPQEPLPMPQRAVVLGTGPIGAGIAQALGRHGLDVVGVNRSGSPAPGFAMVHPWPDLERAMIDCDLLVAALPASSSTRGIIDVDVLKHLGSAQLVNVGRGSTLDLDGLRTALDDGHVSHAHIDVFDREPLDVDSWLWTHPAVRITPHVAALTVTEDVVDAIVAAFHDLSRGLRPALSVDQQGLA
jgi:phosphoglycerate dehydrogenase-like enzyme